MAEPEPGVGDSDRNFIYDDNGQLIKCTESRGQFDKATYTYEYDEAGNRTFAKKEKLYSYLESWQIRNQWRKIFGY